MEGYGLLRVYVVPRASRNKLCGFHGDALKIAITAAPVDGKANKAIISFLAKLFSLRKRDLGIQSGEHSRSKTLVFFTVGKQEIQDHLQMFIRTE